ncbi:hypothetical protein EUX98_g9241 [Antrodiella citrinella]|uniref:HAT C-terminal dimerisation domain-containing protein n=1 Tax=Antrodiella citrinella TaxID=2447956 RepID=A0A4S4LWC6_9APHY|nr:hypothetical protein EUX98_g9241 [Antrodiella citrinella]
MASRRKRRRRDSSPSTSNAPEPSESASGRTSPIASGSSQPARQLTRREVKILDFNKRYSVDEKSDKEVLAAQMLNWTSNVYQHFKMPPEIEEESDGNVRYKFVCNQPNGSGAGSVLTRARWDDSTSNLLRHVKDCSPTLPKAGQAINDFAHGSTYNKAQFRYLLSLWVARRHRPYAIVQDDELVQAFRMLYSRVEIPSAMTVSRDVQEIFKHAQIHVAKKLQEFPGLLHIGLDGWTSPNVISFLGVTVHYVEDAKLRSFILDFVKLTKSHTGKHLAEELTKCLKVYGIQNKILGIAGDSASNNDTLVAELSLLLGGPNDLLTRIRCLAHILNLIVKAILSLFALPRRAQAGAAGDDTAAEDDDDDEELAALQEDEEELEPTINEAGERADASNDEFVTDADREAADNAVIAEIIAEVEAGEDMRHEDLRAARFALTKLSQLAKRVFHSPAIREDLQMSCERCNIKSMQMIRTVATRWNSMAEAITRALYLRPALEKLLSLPRYDKAGKTGLKRFRLLAPEWLILEQLEPVLKRFLAATLRLSQSKIPLLHETIPVIDKLTTHLENVIADQSLSKPVCFAAARGLKILNKYYSLTDDSIMYRLAMLLHPRYKAEYFKRQQWPADWIKTALDLLRDQWVTHYKPKPEATPSAAAQASASLTTATTTDDDFFDADDFGYDGNTASSDDPLDVYLAGPTVPNCMDPLLWWTSLLGGRNGKENALARMALDFLSAPATLTDVERAFSSGSLTVSKRRYALTDASVRAATVISSWAATPGTSLIPEADIVKVFKAKSKRTKATSVENVYDDDDTLQDVEVIEIHD